MLLIDYTLCEDGHKVFQIIYDGPPPDLNSVIKNLSLARQEINSNLTKRVDSEGNKQGRYNSKITENQEDIDRNSNDNEDDCSTLQMLSGVEKGKAKKIKGTSLPNCGLVITSSPGNLDALGADCDVHIPSYVGKKHLQQKKG
ncbi:hypothetical protein AAG570_005234 [Ranatra chinensis]|uniref:Uncharacterized protein n=1 Tax=Ranatra chinensis TaxID=642074 RepID=A0ABD0XZU5_9HEMI